MPLQERPRQVPGLAAICTVRIQNAGSFNLRMSRFGVSVSFVLLVSVCTQPPDVLPSCSRRGARRLETCPWFGEPARAQEKSASAPRTRSADLPGTRDRSRTWGRTSLATSRSTQVQIRPTAQILGPRKLAVAGSSAIEGMLLSESSMVEVKFLDEAAAWNDKLLSISDATWR